MVEKQGVAPDRKQLIENIIRSMAQLTEEERVNILSKYAQKYDFKMKGLE